MVANHPDPKFVRDDQPSTISHVSSRELPAFSRLSKTVRIETLKIGPKHHFDHNASFLGTTKVTHKIERAVI
jgi:hypothetical protein